MLVIIVNFSCSRINRDLFSFYTHVMLFSQYLLHKWEVLMKLGYFYLSICNQWPGLFNYMTFVVIVAHFSKYIYKFTFALLKITITNTYLCIAALLPRNTCTHIIAFILCYNFCCWNLFHWNLTIALQLDFYSTYSVFIYYI